MQATFQAKIADEALHPAFDAIADLYGHAERTLYVDLYVRGQRWESCKSEYLSRFGLTARQFNAIRITLGGKVEAARQGLLLRVANLRAAVDATARAVAKLTKELKSMGRRPKRKGGGLGPASRRALHLRSGRFVHDAEQAERRARTASRLHQKRRRLENLRARLAAAEEDRRAGRIHLCFGGKRLFRRQFAWRENGYADLAGWRREWRRARSSQFFCVGSKDETAGNQTCTRQPDGSLRLCVPPALAERFGHWLTIPSVRLAYGQEVLEAAVAAGQAVSYRFVRRERRGTDAWYVHATVERAPATVETSVHVGALGIDLNPAHVEVAEVDRFGNPVHVTADCGGHPGTAAATGDGGAGRGCGRRCGTGEGRRQARGGGTVGLSGEEGAVAREFEPAGPAAISLCLQPVASDAVLPRGTGRRPGDRDQPGVHVGDWFCQVWPRVRAFAACRRGGGDRAPGFTIWGAVPVQVRPRPTCKESDEARLERLASCGPRAAGGLALGAVSGRQY